MNVYDFDKTIYEGDSTIDFYLFCLKKYPQILKYFPKQILGMLKYKMKSINKTQFKEDFFSFLREIPDVKKEVRIFWKRKKKKIKKWYIEQRKPDDVIISASPEYLLKEICDELEIKYLIASKVEEKNGKFMGENCYGEEKRIRFQNIFGNVDIEKFYTDSYSDKPMACIAQKAYIVKKNNIIQWM